MRIQKAVVDAQLRVEIYRFTRYDREANKMVLSKRWGTKEKIREIYGVCIHDSRKFVDRSAVESDIMGLTEEGYVPPD